MSTAKLDDSTQRPLYGERIIEESKIICFENPNKKRIYEISIQLPEFTCKCPFSGYPDFAKLNIIYQPNLRVYELKSLKLYINNCLLYTSPSPRDPKTSRMPSSA